MMIWMKNRSGSLRVLLGMTVLLASLALVGCMNTKPALKVKTYMLSVPKIHTDLPKKEVAGIRLNSVGVSPSYGSPFMVYQVSSVRFEKDYYHRFFDLPSNMFGQVIYQAMLNAKAFKYVISPQMGRSAPYALSIRIDQLYADYTHPDHPQAVLGLNAMLETGPSAAGSKIIYTHSYRVQEPISPQTPVGLVNAWDKSLATLLPKMIKDVVAQIHQRSHLKANLKTQKQPIQQML